MGKYALLLLGGLGLTTLFYTQTNLSQNRRIDEARLREHGLEVLARESAMSGYNEAVYTLRGTPGAESFAPLTGRSDEARIRVEGRAQVGHEPPAEHIVEATFVDADGTPGSGPFEILQQVPTYLRYAVFSDAPLRFLVLPRVLTNGPGFNADVHTNGNLNLALSVNALLGLRAVEGFGSYGGTLYHIPLLARPQEAFRPNVNPGGGASLQATSPLPLPEFDVQEWVSHATRIEPGTIRLLGRTRLGTRENPEVVYVRGDLIVVDSQFEGYGTFLVEGSVIYEGTVTGALGLLFGQPESRVAFYTNGPVLFNGLGDFQGQILTNSTVTFSGATTLYGNIAARGAVNFLVAPTIRFTPPSPALTTFLPNNPPAEELALVSFREWEVHH
jgi:hypothetical protein